MKITFILPGIGKKPGERYIGTWKMEPLMIAMLKAVTPPEIQTEFFDDRLELIDYDTETDAVALTVETYTALRAYRIAERFRQRGIPIIMGGYHPTLLPDEAMEHADSIVTGNAEVVWPSVLNDLAKGQLRRLYAGTTGFANSDGATASTGTTAIASAPKDLGNWRAASPDRSVLAGKKYLPLSLVETGRGCTFNCEFCAVTAFHEARYCPRPIRDVLADIEASPHKNFFLVDDNIVANQEYSLNLFRAMAPLRIKWSSQGSLTMARNPRLLEAMRKSGCTVILIGFESLEPANLRQMGKEWNARLGETGDLIKRIHDAGIGIYGTFLFGYDHDTRDAFERAVEFSLKHKFFFAAFNHLLPFPGTPLYRRLKDEGRLLREKWWLDSDYTYGDISFVPKHMSPEELSDGCARARRQFFSLSSAVKRGVALMGRNPDPLTNLLFWTQNVRLGKEVEGKLRIPVGSGLDELPK